MPVRVKRPSSRVIKKPASAKRSGSFPVGKKRETTFEKAKRDSGVTGYSAAKGFKQAQREKAKSDRNRQKYNLPFRLWLPPGTEADFILTSDQPFFMYEHQMKGGDGKPIFERCIKDEGHCPLCSKLNREGYYVMMLEGIDLRGYKDRKGNQVKHSKKLVPVKQSQMAKYERIYKRNGNSFRGIKLHLNRDGERDAVIGNDFEQIGKVSEEKLTARYKDLAKVIDMEDAFKPLSEREMASQYGTARPTGSSDFNKDDDEDDVDDESWD